MSFTLHPQLAADTAPVGDLPVCRVLLMNNSHFPWLVLVPRREGLREIFDLQPDDYQAVMDEILFAAKEFQALTKADKMNVAMLGNQVPQLHIHIIARFKNDVAWPKPVWNYSGLLAPYEKSALDDMLHRSKLCLNITKM